MLENLEVTYTASSRSLFSVCVQVGGEAGDAQWTVVCDRCGRELETTSPLTVVRVPNLAELAATHPEVAQQYGEKLQRMIEQCRSTSKTIILDGETTVESLEGGVHYSMLAHAKSCGRS